MSPMVGTFLGLIGGDNGAFGLSPFGGDRDRGRLSAELDEDVSPMALFLRCGMEADNGEDNGEAPDAFANVDRLL